MGSANRRYGVCTLAAAMAATTFALASPSPASAEGIFDFFFGGLHRAIEPQRRASAYAEPEAAPYGGPGAPVDTSQRYADVGPHSGYCVRTCDGRYFPVRAEGNISAAEMCRAFCPGSETRLYSSAGKIDTAVAADGSRYRDLDHAFLYRQQLVAGCTCNGHDPFGLAHVDVKTDPSLRPGDVVATKAGMVAFTGRNKDRTADFTPANADRALSKAYREKLSEMKIMPPNPGARKQTPVSLPLAAEASRHEGRHQAQLSR
jgi:Protein of unknown function (DUF2865)